MNRSAAAEQLYSAGLLAWEQGHGIAAEPLLQQAVDLAPDHGSALHVLGKLRAHDGKLEEALHLQQRSCLVDPALGWNWFSAGELLARRTDRWRIFDFLWMLHIMDFDTRDDFNHPLLQLAAVLGLIIALSGVVFWAMTTRLFRRASSSPVQG